ncbi:unnamed protein product [Chrysodeixis includens]|uniref:Uncharacterized protein n=1 Tax=Chrysodeixis includens TaxID=689277 RepID=A0A9P0FVM4_CHRIL|nr:unnamed protein product [Chrysodeixis includens]
MELHLHLSVAFRALDRKWGTPVDLVTPEDLSPCLPAVVDLPTTTFSSEEFLRARLRPTPYSRAEVKRRRRDNVKVNDSFADISCARIPSLTDLTDLELSSCYGSAESVVTSSSDPERCMEEYLEDYESRSYKAGSTDTLDSGLGTLGSKKRLNMFRQFKDTAKAYIRNKRSS